MKAKSLTKKTMQITLLYLKRFSRYEFSKLEFAKKNRRFFWKWERVAETTSISVQFVQNGKALEESLFYKTCRDESGLSRKKSYYWLALRRPRNRSILIYYWFRLVLPVPRSISPWLEMSRYRCENVLQEQNSNNRNSGQESCLSQWHKWYDIG